MATPLDEIDFAVFDVETTGLFPQCHDRVIEIAVTRLTAGRKVSAEYVTLVNPGRDLGPTEIHGIAARDILAAPEFAEIIGDVLGLLADAVVVAHNIRFDTGFLIAECERAGVRLPRFPMLCTQRLATVLGDGLVGRNLIDCCGHFGIKVEHQHSARHDARACAQLLATCIRRARKTGIETLDDLIGSEAQFATDWPRLPRSGKSLCRSDADRLHKSQPNYLAHLVTRLLSSVQKEVLTPDASEYLGLLDKVLEDRMVSVTEAKLLYSAAKEYGLTGEQIALAHRSYLEGLAQAAWADGVVTDTEMKDLVEVTRLLGFKQKALSKALDKAKSQPAQSPTAETDLKGKSVCFTGTLMGKIDGKRIEKQQAYELAENAGMIGAKSVTKKLNVLVVADPHTLSGKAQKAREYGTRIIAEMAFWRAIGASVD